MFFILTAAAFVASIVLLLVYVIQMNHTKKKYLGKDAVKDIAEKAAEASLKTKTVLTCDYCGFVTDTTKYKVCPQCGAPYGEDREWQDRTSVDEKQMRIRISSAIAENRDRLKSLNAARMKRVRNILIAFGAVTAIFVVMLGIGLATAVKDKNRSDTADGEYVAAGYSFTDKLIGDNGGIRVEFGDIYVKRENYTGEQKTSYEIEVRFMNPEKKKGTLVLYLAAANSKCFDGIFYEEVGAKEEIVRILELPYYCFGDDVLKTLVIYDARFSGNDYDQIIFQKEAKTFETDADYSVQDLQIKGDIILVNHNLSFSLYRESGRTYLQITNTGDDDYNITTYTPKADEDSERIWIHVFVPARCQYEDELTEPGEGEEQILQLECECYSRPDISFITDSIMITDMN